MCPHLWGFGFLKARHEIRSKRQFQKRLGSAQRTDRIPDRTTVRYLRHRCLDYHHSEKEISQKETQQAQSCNNLYRHAIRRLLLNPHASRAGRDALSRILVHRIRPPLP